MPTRLKAAIRWHLEWGPSREFLEARAEAKGTIPPALEKLPDLLEHQRFALELFFMLSPSRPMGFGAAGGITTADIMAVADESGFDPLEWLHLCRAMDSVYLEHVHKKNEPQKPKKPKE